MCVEEVPLLQQLYSAHRAAGAEFLGISLDEDFAALDQMIARKSIPWPQLADGQGTAGAIPKAYRVEGTPVLYVIDRQGRILLRYTSAKPLANELPELLAIPASAPPRQARDVWQRPFRVMDLIGAQAGSSVADIGVGGGYFTFHLASRVGAKGRVYAVDIDDASLGRLRERATKEGLAQIATVRGEVNNPNLSADSLDAALIVDAYHEFTEYDAMLLALFKAKPGGKLGILDHAGALGKQRTDYNRMHNIPAELVIEDAARNGFRLRLFDAEFVREEGGRDHFSYFIVFEKPKTQ